MPVIVVIIIAVAWIVILGPNMMKRRSRTVRGSVSHFHRALRTLEHAAPEPIVPPAYRLRSVGGAGQPGASPDAPARPVLTAVGADKLPRPALAFLGDPPGANHNGGAGASGAAAGTGPGPAAARALRSMHDPSGPPEWSDAFDAFDARGGPADGHAVEAYSRRLARRRRRDTLGILAAVFVGTLMIGFVPGAGDAWIVSAISGVVLAAYVAMLVRLRRGAEEREQKLRYLGTAVAVQPNGAARLPVYMSGRYAHPSNQAAAAR